MPNYKYIGRDKDGKETRGSLNASNQDGVATRLLQEGIIPIKIYKDEVSTLKKILQFEITPTKIKTEEMIAFCRQMQTMIKVGISIVDALIHIGNSSQSRTLKRILPDISEAISSGKSFTDALKEHPKIFGTVFINIISAGERSGQLEYSFEQLTAYLQLEDKTIKRIKSATRYPLIVLLTIIVAIAIVNIVVIPAFADLFNNAGADLPGPTKVIIATSNFFVAYWMLILFMIIVMFISFKIWVRTKKGRLIWHYFILKLPAAGKILSNAMLGRFARIFSMTIRTGIPIVQGIHLVSETLGNDFVAYKVLLMKDGLEKGESITKVANGLGLFPPMVMQMLSIGEETGSLDSLLLEVAIYYEGEVEYDLNRLSDLIEPIMLVITGGLVAFIAVGVFLPMWSISSIVKA